MAKNKEDFWTTSDNIEDIEGNQPYGIISMIEYGMSENDTPAADKTDDFQFGYGRGIPTRAAYSELAADIRQYNVSKNKMGQLLTTEDVLQLNLHDEDIIDTGPETIAMLRSAGINKYDDSKFASYRNEDSNKILSKPIVNGKSFPILLDDSFHKFNIKTKNIKTSDDDNEAGCSSNHSDSVVLNNGNDSVNNDSQCKDKNSNNIAPSYIAFGSVLCPNTNEQHNHRYRQPTIGVDREKFIKPVEVYFEKKTKHIKKKKSSNSSPSK